MFPFRKVKKCPQCKANSFKIRERTIHAASLNPKTGVLEAKGIIENEVLDAYCIDCGKSLNLRRINLEFVATE